MKAKAVSAQAAGARSAKIRAGVERRAEGKCEQCFWACEPLYLDHWLGGSGRRRERQAVENTWLLCFWCHRDRTDSYPSAAEWNERFARHCFKHGYPFVPHIEHAELARRPK